MSAGREINAEQYPEIIISHPGTDFDSLASMWAAHLLNPEKPVVMIAGADSNVREFLALYGNEFPRKRLKEIDISAVRHLTVVDCSSRSQLGRIEGLLDRDDVTVELWDHHRPEGPDFRVDTLHYASIGANTTMLVQEIIANGILITQEEATLLLLGIYEDTGSLRFPSTTPDDLNAASWLLQSGASLDIVDRFHGIRLNRAQKELMTTLGLNVRVVEVRGIPIHVTTATANEFVDEIAFLAKKVQETDSADVLFALVQLNDRVFIVGRSRLPSVDVGRILSMFGGGGHPQAASCLLAGTTSHVALQRLLDAVREEVRPTVRAADIMTEHVRTVDPDVPMADAHSIIAHTGYSGLVVTDEENRVVGVITRPDTTKALHHGLGHAPVKGYMDRDPVTIGEDTALGEIQNTIIEKRVGFLPVVFAGKVRGVVTRTDVLRALHTQTERPEVRADLPNGRKSEDLGRELIVKLPERIVDILADAGEVADSIGVSVYLVGGIVRDLVIGRRNVDIDLLIEGDGIDYAHHLARKIDGRVIENPRFRTAKILLKDEEHIDIATAREEFYIRPGALPEVAAAGIRDDLVRRDFTVNTLAIQLNTRKWGLLVDHFGGLADIENGLIRVLHTFSFVDDPTRILRALKIAERCCFELESQTAELLERALLEGRLDDVSPERVRDEILLCLHEDEPWPVLRRLCDEGVFGILHPGLFPPECLRRPDDPVKPAIEWMSEFMERDEFPEIEMVYMAMLLSRSDPSEAREFITRFHFDRGMMRVVEALPMLERARETLRKSDVRPSEIAVAIESLPIALWIVLAADTPPDSPTRKNLRKFLSDIRHVQPEIDGNDLINAGYEPGPSFSKVLEKIRHARMNGEISSRDEEMQMAKRMLGER